MTTTQETISKVCDDIKTMLIKKNEDYGNSFHEPLGLFSSLTPVAGLNVRIDDKLKRLQTLFTSKDDANYESITDSVRDLAGYLILWLVEAE